MKRILVLSMAMEAAVALAGVESRAGDGCIDGRAARIRCATGTFLTSYGCTKEHHVRCGRVRDARDARNFVVGRLVDTFEGEMDPHVVGDACIVYLKPINGKKSLGLHDGAPDSVGTTECALTRKLSDAAPGRIVEVPRSRVSKITDRDVIRELEDFRLASTDDKSKGKGTYYRMTHDALPAGR